MRRRSGGRLANRKMYVLGLMSGTSADGIDVALTEVSGTPPFLKAKLHDFASIAYPRRVRSAVLRLSEGEPTSTAEISQLNFLLGELFADAAIAACRRFRVPITRIDLIGSHGQTIYHQGKATSFLGAGRISSTLQIGEPALIAGLTGVTTVGDFRPADMAAGGQGAPLVPFVDFLLYRDAKEGRASLNIGGIANVTVIPACAHPEDVFAFDTGPGNMVVDALVSYGTNGRRTYDRDAKLARKGKLLPGLLNSLLASSYFRVRPPKSAGREQYGKEYVARLLDWSRAHRAKPEDLVRTATVFTALSIVDAWNRFVAPKAHITKLIVSGGGAHNPLLMTQLAALLGGVNVLTSAQVGIPEDAKEAFAFAILAYETFHGRPSNLPSATGAKRPAILGKVCYARR
ncbi:MAG TPA: anhydro-N-acetylmuramic acid kinase [Candidatus Acidoferrales bacterium]|nr:anhydro-N-acetylmuramic acid kinase [Candidatus Acidoferrales bacterium]